MNTLYELMINDIGIKNYRILKCKNKFIDILLENKIDRRITAIRITSSKFNRCIGFDEIDCFISNTVGNNGIKYDNLIWVTTDIVDDRYKCLLDNFGVHLVDLSKIKSTINNKIVNKVELIKFIDSMEGCCVGSIS